MNHKVIVIAEAGVNHNGDINVAKKLIDVALQAGADYVKFQTFKAKKTASKSARKAEYQIYNKNKNASQYDMLKSLELDKDSHQILIEYCKEKKIKFLSTGFDLESLDLLNKLNIELFKIPSGEITNLPYLKKVASFKKPVIISTGMCKMKEIKEALDVMVDKGISKENIIILHCNTDYPTVMEDVNLNAMLTIKKEFGVEVGYSDHTLGIEVPIAAVALGAVCIEKHFTLDRNMSGPDHKSSLEPKELKKMVNYIRNTEIALGSSIKSPSKSESKNINIVRKSIHINKSLKRGHILSKDDFIMLRPGDGISPMGYEALVNKELKKDLSMNHKLNLEDLK